MKRYLNQNDLKYAFGQIITEKEIIVTKKHSRAYIASIGGINMGGRTEDEAINRLIAKDL